MNADAASAVSGLLWLVPALAAVVATAEIAARRGSRRARVLLRAVVTAPPRRHLIALALLATSAIHAALVPAHLDEAPLLGVLFAVAAAAGAALVPAVYLNATRWRPAAALLFTGLITGYVITRSVGFEEWDTLGLATKIIEFAGMALVITTARSEAVTVPT